MNFITVDCKKLTKIIWVQITVDCMTALTIIRMT